MKEFETFNRWGVCVRGDCVYIAIQPIPPLSRDKAMMLAAYLLELASAAGLSESISDEEFAAARDAIA